jgi:hypothetical protein
MEQQFAIRQQIENLRLYGGVHLSLLEIHSETKCFRAWLCSSLLGTYSNINGRPRATGYRLFGALSVFMDLRLSIYPLVDLKFLLPV